MASVFSKRSMAYDLGKSTTNTVYVFLLLFLLEHLKISY